MISSPREFLIQLSPFSSIGERFSLKVSPKLISSSKLSTLSIYVLKAPLIAVPSLLNDLPKTPILSVHLSISLFSNVLNIVLFIYYGCLITIFLIQ